MSTELSYLPELSVHLSQVLDEVGVNELTVQRRRQRTLENEQLETILTNFTWNDRYKDMSSSARLSSTGTKGMSWISLFYQFGSQSEGTTSLGLHSDVDILRCDTNVNVIQDLKEWKQGQVNLLMLHDDTAPGYCRLQSLYIDEPLPSEYLPNEHFTYDRCNRVLAKNTGYFAINIPNTTRHGPARTYAKRIIPFEVDSVTALRCRSWPIQADQFKLRYRCGRWPSPHFTEQAVTDGVFLVPVGCKLSPTESLEWRMSFSLTERRLMFSLNMTQIKCYVVLKMLKQTFITPHVGDSISSYHCKTALFYCIEELGVQFWREENLLQGIMKCLNLLLVWVRDEFCPHFIIPESNLFAGKINEHNKFQVHSILSALIKSNGQCLLRVTIDDLGQHLQMKLSTLSSSVNGLGSLFSRRSRIQLMVGIEVNYMITVARVSWMSLSYGNPWEPVTILKQVHEAIYFLCSQISQSESYRKQAIHTFIPFLSFWLGSMLTSLSLSRKRGIPKEAVPWLSFCVKPYTCIASELKLASIFYCSGDLPKTATTLLDVDGRYRNDTVESLCVCYDHTHQPTDKFLYQQLDAADGKFEILSGECVRFSRHEVHCAPPALQYEFYRSTGDDMLRRDCVECYWMDLAVVDSLPCLYYLQYITYGRMGKHALQKEALHSLEQCLVEDKVYGHLETVWSLLGQCMEQEGKLEAAMNCYRTSLEIRPRNNAAIWRVAVLIYKEMKNCATSI